MSLCQSCLQCCKHDISFQHLIGTAEAVVACPRNRRSFPPKTPEACLDRSGCRKDRLLCLRHLCWKMKLGTKECMLNAGKWNLLGSNHIHNQTVTWISTLKWARILENNKDHTICLRIIEPQAHEMPIGATLETFQSSCGKRTGKQATTKDNREITRYPEQNQTSEYIRMG